MTDVLVTGLGAVTCHGVGVGALLAAMTAGSPRAPELVADPYAHMRLPLIHRVPEPDPEDDAAPRRATRFAVAAAREAVADAGVAIARSSARVAVIVGTCMGEPVATEPGWHAMFPIAAAVADDLGAFGATTSLSNACAASGYAVTVAADMISSGEVDIAIAGGADAYSRVGWACFDRLGAIDEVRCRPFDLHRTGTVLSEGAGMVALESDEHARARGARAYATIAGTAWSCDAYHLTAPEPTGQQITRAISGALGRRDAGSVGCVVPHGTGTRLNDAVESRALRQVFGSRLESLPLYSMKALVGHTGGAAAALATVAGALIAHRGVVPPNVALDEQDPECAVYLPQDAAVPLDTPGVLINAYAFGGNNASLLLEAV
jgi:3-oxoacyl-[acyl-carrier-protein] synthase II